ncbi:hypothetical protein KQH49_08770 [Mycetohabitans sp. B5]|uniref:Uncharacterized protein n=1 Tax=Mycetohabitans endofungorum TaxID=417203 RepID=A0A2P5K758_9BURK|nr:MULTISPECIES: hypothetical protein [Mycetohabitans]MCG1055040.1 hypothetical protein [Mycetohabitans sp. B5]PPB81904.1 hypothetical protein B0O95_11820 [Mycetohabitans endofungorum]
MDVTDSMTTPPTNFDLSDPSLRETIHFETLWARARAAIDNAASQWTDYGDHDPGITLLQAVTYGIADLAYRHTHPLVDLLTPPSNDGYVFPKEFGPGAALACNPITADDYRRVILDLCLDEERHQQFYFRNVHWVKETLDESYTYWYSPGIRQFQFDKFPDDAKELRLLGGYRVWLEPQRGIKDNVAKEEAAKCLRRHRNLCEQVRTIDCLQPKSVVVVIEADLEDDCQESARVMAEVFAQVEDWLRPGPTRASTQVLRERGAGTEAIYNGPQLANGWITSLPPARDPAQAVKLDLRGLPQRLLAIDGLTRVRVLNWGDAPDKAETTNPWIREVEAGHYPLVYGESPDEMLSSSTSPVKLYKRGQRLTPLAQDIAAHMPSEPRYAEKPQGKVAGQPRKLDEAINIASLLPPCYGLQDEVGKDCNPKHVDLDDKQVRLCRYLKPFEQWLTDGARQLGALPTKLSFVRKQQTDEADYFRSEERELAIIDYLMGYFGSARAPRVFAGDDFIPTQQRALSEWAQLGYQRAHVQVDQVSALVKRIAARLGIGAALFDAKPDLSQLPIYLIEYRALLPEMPNPKFIDAKPTAASATDKTLELVFKDTEKDHLPRAGQMVSIAVGGDKPFIIKWALVTQINLEARALTLDLGQNPVLQQKVQRIKENIGTVQCSGCQIWLYGMEYKLQYAADQSALQPSEKRLWVELSVNSFKEGEKLSFASRSQSQQIGLREVAWTGEVISVDVANGLLVVDSGGNVWPNAQDTHSTRWYRTHERNPEHERDPEHEKDPEHEQDPELDLFSFKVGVVLNRTQWLSPKAIAVDQPNDVIRWVEQIVQEEMPAHVNSQIHWLDQSAFVEFGNDYAVWQAQASDVSLGDKTYALLEKLALGRLPDAESIGIGVSHVITADELRDPALVDAANHQWTTEEMVRSAEVLYVPRPTDGVDVLHVATDDDMANLDLLDPATQAWHELASVKAAQIVYVPRLNSSNQPRRSDSPPSNIGS